MLLTNEMMDGVFKTMFWHVKIRVTTRCNMACAHCYAASEQYKTYEHERLENFEWVDRLAKNPRIRFLHLQGGEPTLEPEAMKECAKISHHYGKQICLFTNGKRLYEDENFRNEFLSYGIDNIVVSYNKYLEAQTDQAKVVNTLMHFFEDKPNINFGTTAIVDRKHISNLQKWIDFGGWPPYHPEDFPDYEEALENRKYWKMQLPLCWSDRGEVTGANEDVPRVKWPGLTCDFSTVLMPSGFLQADCGCSSVKQCLLGFIDDFGDDPIEYIAKWRGDYGKFDCYANGFYEFCLAEPGKYTCLKKYPPRTRPDSEYEERMKF